MADIIKTNTSKLANDSARVKSYIKNLQEKKKELDQKVQRMNSMWEGEAYKGFCNAVRDDLNALQTVIDNLENVYDYEQRAKSEYEKCENKISRIISSVHIKEVM